MLAVTEAWRTAYPGAAGGALLLRQVANPEQHAALEQEKVALEEALRARFAGQERAALAALPSIRPYVDYYRRFKKTYHVLLQLESVALKGKPLPRVAALVETMFMAELRNGLLTAIHDADVLAGPVTLDVATGSEHYTLLNGQEQTLKPGDMFIADAHGVISSIVYGPDARTRVTSETTAALYTVYAPAGIGAAAVDSHLRDIAAYAQLVAPQAEITALVVIDAG